MYTLDEAGEYSEEIKKSKFICLVRPVTSADEAMEFIKQNSDPAARHNCWAWKIGNDYRFNDDGEPSGTAGKPIFNAIEYAEVTNVVALVIRWFGGVKLGTGGLCRAYGGVTSSCLKKLSFSEIKQMRNLEVLVPFEFTNAVYHLIETQALSKEFEEYEDKGLRLKLSFEEKLFDTITDSLQEISRGRVILKD